MVRRENFEVWFQKLVFLAQKRGLHWLIDSRNRHGYREYWEDGDTHAQVIQAELSSRCKSAPEQTLQ